jgi:diguanylate cyclase (GGDEF)-like protein
MSFRVPDACPPLSGDDVRKPGRAVALLQVLALLAAPVVIALTTASARWSVAPLLVIMVFCGVSTLTEVETGSSHLQVSGSFLGIVLAAALLGGGPGAVVGVFTDLLAWIRVREAPHYFRNNLAAYAWFPLASGLFFHATIHIAGASVGSPGYYLLVFAMFVVALALNFLAVAGYQCYLDRSSLGAKFREALIPLLSAELFSALLTVASVYMAVQLGTPGLMLFGIVLMVFQYLIAELLRSKQRAAELHRKATSDELTGLVNRERFHAQLEEQINSAAANNDTFAVLLLDLDRFKEVNDNLGHQYGDELLRTLGERLAITEDVAGMVARLGGDEFALLTPSQPDISATVEQVAAKLIACVQRPILVDEMMLDLDASVGIARFPTDGEDAHTLLRRADIAMYAAKQAHAGLMVFEDHLDLQSARRLGVLSDFRRVLESGQIVVYYQPIVDARDSRLVGAEGLVRWEHPELGLIPPGDFIPTVEQSQLIGPLTRHVLEQAIAQCAAWRRETADLSVSVNLSVRNLLDRELPRDIESFLSAFGMPADALQLEITESMLMSDPDRARATVLALTELGVRIAVDDFGTGYSSLANLRRLPIDELKVDRSFVSHMLKNDSDRIIVGSTINLGHDLGLRVTAEGVEDLSTMHYLAHLGCDLVQGFHISKPVPPKTLTAWMDDQVAHCGPRAAGISSELNALAQESVPLIAPARRRVRSRR